MKIDEIRSQNILKNHPMACIEQLLGGNQLISNRSYRRKYWHTYREEKYYERVKQFMEEHIVLTSDFEIGKNYNRFFPKFNKKNVLEKLVKTPDLIQKDSFFSANY